MNGRVLALLLVVAAGYDVITTNAALGFGQVEGNPLMQAVQSEFGSWWSVPKMAFHLALATFVLWLPTRKMLSVARIVVIGYAAIALNNLYLSGASI